MCSQENDRCAWGGPPGKGSHFSKAVALMGAHVETRGATRLAEVQAKGSVSTTPSYGRKNRLGNCGAGGSNKKQTVWLSRTPPMTSEKVGTADLLKTEKIWGTGRTRKLEEKTWVGRGTGKKCWKRRVRAVPREGGNIFDLRSPARTSNRDGRLKLPVKRCLY